MLYDQMKQKRKVKSLLPQKSYSDGKFLTILLLVLSLVLCLGSVSLVTHSVGAQSFAGNSTQSTNLNGTTNGSSVPGSSNHDGTNLDGTLPGSTLPGSANFDGTTHGNTLPDGTVPGNGNQNGTANGSTVPGDIVRTDRTSSVTVEYYKGDDMVNEITKTCNVGQPIIIVSPEIEYYYPEPQEVIVTCTYRPITQRVDYIIKHDLNGDNIPDEEQNLQEVTEFDYTGIDNTLEVLYSMQFVDPLDLQKIVNNIFMSGLSLYITPNPVIVNPRNNVTNKVESGVYSHILGGRDNEIYSNNVTIIAGRDNKVLSGNDNLSILGGQSNLIATGSGVPDVVVGGDSNFLDNSLGGNAIIGGFLNGIEGAKNSFILGGSGNNVGSDEYSGNLIVGGLRVTVAGKSNMFVYSNSGEFSPLTNNAFYLNMLSGAGINTTGVDGLSVGGAVSIGDTDIYAKYCNSDNLGVVGVYEGCLVGCTQASVLDGKWEMLDQGNRCAQVCTDNSSRCIYNENIEEAEVNDHPAQCIVFVSGLNTGNADLCVSDAALNSYKNVFFETTLIDSEDECPNGVQNACFYRCKTGYHLHENQCKQDCEYQWYDGTVEIIRHLGERDGYETGSVNCSSDDGRGNRTCADYKKRLICDNGVMKVKGTNNIAQSGYYHRSCEMIGYRCDTDFYNLTLDDITNVLGDTIPSTYTDRATVTGTKGVYKVCLDYGGVDEVTCTTGDAHFFLSGCRAGYSRDPVTGICKKDCGNLAHGTTGMFYKTGSATCTGVCDGQIFTCIDGSWTGNYNKADYPSTSCKLNGKVCSGFGLSYDIYLSGREVSFYDSCTKYSASGNTQCMTGDTNYKLTGCVEDYHTENWQWCEYNRRPYNCTGNPDHSYWEGGTGREIVWSGSWSTGRWEGPVPPCNWICESGYRKSPDGKSCVKISDECGEEPYTCVDSGATMTPKNNNGNGSGAIWTCENNWCAKCDEETSYKTGSRETLRCDKNVNGECGDTHYNCVSGNKHERDETDGWYLWDCLGIGSGEDDLGCFECKDGYVENDVNGDIKCKRLSYTCPPRTADRIYQCKGENEDYVQSTNTGYDDNGDYEWWCGDYHCNYPNDDPIPSLKRICRNVEYETCGNVFHLIIKKVSFRSSDANGFSVRQPFIFKVVNYPGQIPGYATCTCSQTCGDGYCNLDSCSGGAECEALSEGNHSYLVSVCSDNIPYGGKIWFQYIDSLGEPEVLSPGYESDVNDCPTAEPKCGNSTPSCIGGDVIGFNSETNTWYCDNGFSSSVKCQYSCDCPVGYVRDGNECRQYLEFCAEPVSKQEMQQSCNVENVDYGQQARTCFGETINSNGDYTSDWPNPNALSSFSCNNEAGWEGYLWDTNTFIFHFQPRNTSSLQNCTVNRAASDILEQCFDEYLIKYKGLSDNGYYIESCPFTYDGAVIGEKTGGCSCGVRRL